MLSVSARKGIAKLLLVLCATSACGVIEVDNVHSQCEDESKCDGAIEPATPHIEAVEACDTEWADSLGEASTSDAMLVSHEQWRSCLILADDAAQPVIVDNAGAAYYSEEAVDAIFAEFRYASLCPDLRLASSSDADVQKLVAHECEGHRERALAEAVAALVDFRDSAIEIYLHEAREEFPTCYEAWDELDPAASDSERRVAAEVLAACARQVVLGRADEIVEATCEQAQCTDITEPFIRAGLSTFADTSERMCSLLVAASPYRAGSTDGPEVDCQIYLFQQGMMAIDLSLGAP